MADRFKFAEVRQKVIDIMKMDLLGPSSEEEVLSQNPRFEYLVGMLAPQTNEDDGSNEQEVDGDASFEGDDNYTAGEEDDNEPVSTNRFKTPSSIGISFYVESGTSGFNVDVSWGDYVKSTDKTVNKDGKEINVNTYTRHPQKETIAIELDSFSKSQEYPLVCDSNVVLYISKIGLRQGYTLVTAYVINRRNNSESDIAGLMFQVKLRAYSPSGENIFFAEHICRKILAVDEFYFAQRPILGRGRGCAATWKANANGRASEISSTFIPEYEFPGVSAALEGFDPFYFSMRTLSVLKNKKSRCFFVKSTDRFGSWYSNHLYPNRNESDRLSSVRCQSCPFGICILFCMIKSPCAIKGKAEKICKISRCHGFAAHKILQFLRFFERLKMMM